MFDPPHGLFGVYFMILTQQLQEREDSWQLVGEEVVQPESGQSSNRSVQTGLTMDLVESVQLAGSVWF